jgi:hypothetical protein
MTGERKLRLPQSLASRGFSKIVTMFACYAGSDDRHVTSLTSRKIEGCNEVGVRQFCNCTKSCHAPVDVLYSTENKRNKNVNFLLTSDTGGVKHTRSLTSFPLPVSGWFWTDARLAALLFGAE